MQKSPEILQALGLNPKNAGKHDFSALTKGGKRNFGALLEDATLGLDALQQEAMNAPLVKSVPANAMDGENRLSFDEGQQFMVIDGKVKGLFSDRFEPYQHGDALDDIQKAMAELGVTKTANTVRFDNDGARLSAHIFMPSFFGDFNLLEDTGEDILLGIVARNGHDGSNALGLSVVGIRTICYNYSLRGLPKWSVSISHTNTAMVRKWKDALQDVRKNLASLPEVINAAKAQEVAIKDVAPLMLGLGLPEPYVIGGKRGHVKTLPALGVNPWAYNPEIPVGAKTANLWQVVNAGTALLSHAYEGAPQQVERLTACLGKALAVRSLDGLIAAGQDTLAALQEKAAENAKA